MRHHIFKESNNYEVAILVKNTSFNKQAIQTNYVDPLVKLGIPEDKMIAFTLDYNQAGKAPAAYIKEYLAKLLPALEGLGVKFLLVTDSAYFKVIAGMAKADPHYGYVLPSIQDGMSVVLSLNHQVLIYNPSLQAKLDLSLATLASAVAGTYQAIGSNIIHSASYPKTLDEIDAALKSLHQHPVLTCDIEGFSLRFNEAGIGTIAFAWDKHNGVAFACELKPFEISSTEQLHWGYHGDNQPVKEMLLSFFMSYKGRLVFHNAPYDVKALIYTLWMQNLTDTKGMLHGLDVLTERMDDTKIIAYLATNSTAGNVLGLKSLAHEFAGNWAVEDIKDIRKIPLPELLQYNLVDALSTHYVLEKYYPIMVQDNQLDLYKTLMLPSLKLIMQIELVGMPMDSRVVSETKTMLEKVQVEHLDTIRNSAVVKMLALLLRDVAWNKDFEDRKAKAKNPGKILPKNKEVFDILEFNPNSGPQLQRLLYELMNLPVIDLTDNKQPATGADTLEKLINHTEDPAYKALLEALIGYSKVTKILSTFIPAFEQGIKKDNSHTTWLHGSFNLGGTVSGRLSSSDPNMQNIPANSMYGKMIKTCFAAPDDWLFAGADFNSLEDYISALTTKDPNKLAVYERGFDGHCLRAAYYFKDQCLDIDPTDPVSVNSMKKKYQELRQDSKAPTFLLTYGGTYHGLMNNLGWSEEKAKAIEKGYHDLYKVSDEYVQERLKQASKDGYVEVAFGLRVRTPLLKQVVFGSSGMPYEAAAEGRTAGNALGQSYGLLNNRAAVEFMQKVWDSKYRYDILPVALIHDAIYILIRNDVEIVEWANKELIKSMQWQELPEIQHPTVKLGAALDLFYPSWAYPTTLPNNASQEEILKLCTKK